MADRGRQMADEWAALMRHGLQSPSLLLRKIQLSLRLGHLAVLTVHRTVIHCRSDTFGYL